MKSQIIENTGLKRILKVELDRDEISTALEKELQKIQKTVELKGFRKGKAPINQVKALYSNKASQTVLENLVNKNYLNALEEHKLTPISQPKIDLNLNDKKNSVEGFSFTAEFEIKPEIKLKDLTKLSVTKKKVHVTDAQINEALQKSTEAKTIPIAIDRPAQMADWVKINFEGVLSATNTPVEGGSAKDFLLELGGQSLIKGFEEGIAGMKTGETKTLSLNFPEDYFKNDLSGAPVDFKITLNSINTKEFPEITDKLAKEISGLDSIDAFKKQITAKLIKKQEHALEQKLSDDLLIALEKMHEVDVPNSILKLQAENFKNTTTQRLTQQGMSEQNIEEYHKKWSINYNENALKNIKTSLLIDALAEKENLFPVEKDFTAYYADLSEKTGIDTDKIKSYYETKEQVSELQFKILEKNVVTFLKSKAVITESNH